MLPCLSSALAQSAYEAFGRGDMAALAEVMADDIEWVNAGDPDDDPNAGTFKGQKKAVLGWLVVSHRLSTSRRSNPDKRAPRSRE